MGLLSSAVKAHLAGDGNAHWILTIGTGPTALRYGMGDLASDVNGAYAGKLLEAGGSSRSVADRSNSLQRPSATARLLDMEISGSGVWKPGPGVFSRLAAKKQVRGLEARIQLAAKGIAPADWYTDFVGRMRAPAMTAPFTWSCRLEADDRPLRTPINKVAFTQSDWPNGNPEIWGTRAPRIYGRFDSLGSTKKGAVPGFLVDRTLRRYAFQAAAAKSIERVYSDGVEQATTAYTALPAFTWNGRRWTIVQFNSDQAEKKITADLQGIESVGDGSGTLLSNPADILLDTLVQHAWNDYTGIGAKFSSSTAPMNTADFTAWGTFLSKQGIVGSYYQKGEKTGGAVVDDIVKSHESKSWWNEDGTFSPGTTDHDRRAIYVDDPFFRGEKDTESSDSKIALNNDDANLVESIQVEYLYNPASEGFQASLRVRDRSVGENVDDSISMIAGAGYVL